MAKKIGVGEGVSYVLYSPIYRGAVIVLNLIICISNINSILFRSF